MDASVRAGLLEIQETVSAFPAEARERVAALLIEQLVRDASDLGGGVFPGVFVRA